MKKFVLLMLIIFIQQQAQALEDCVITTKGKLTDIKIEDNAVLNVYPLITIMNDKNTLIVTPLKTGKTRFSVLKNNKERVEFQVEVSEDSTFIKEVKGFDILTIDEPISDEFKLDAPPRKLGGEFNG